MRSKVHESRKMISLPAELAARVDDYRFENRFKNESDAIRRLIEAGLDAESKVSADARA